LKKINRILRNTELIGGFPRKGALECLYMQLSFSRFRRIFLQRVSSVSVLDHFMSGDCYERRFFSLVV